MRAPHTHADIEINMTLKGGSLRYLHGGQILAVPMGRMAVFWAGIPHQLLSPRSDCEGVWMTLPLPWVLQWKLPGRLIQRLLAGELILENAAPGNAGMLERWVGDFQSGDSARRKVLLLEIEARIHRLGLGSRRASPKPPRIPAAGGESLLAAITERLAAGYDKGMSVKEVISPLALNPRYVMRLFRTHSGMTIWEYVLRLRVAHAQRLLITTDQKITDIALESGFGSLAPFYAAFKKYGGGQKPDGFRRKLSPLNPNLQSPPAGPPNRDRF